MSAASPRPSPAPLHPKRKSKTARHTTPAGWPAPPFEPSVNGGTPTPPFEPFANGAGSVPRILPFPFPFPIPFPTCLRHTSKHAGVGIGNGNDRGAISCGMPGASCRLIQ